MKIYSLLVPINKQQIEVNTSPLFQIWLKIFMARSRKEYIMQEKRAATADVSVDGEGRDKTSDCTDRRTWCGET
jgi:hypothetical protein